MILESVFDFLLKNHQFVTGFIMVPATRFWFLRNRVFRWVYKVFRRRGNALRKHSLAAGLLLKFGVIFENGTQKSSFSTGFIRFFDMAECHVRFIYKPNAFLIILEAFLRFWLGNHQFETGFIRVLHKQNWLLRNRVFRWVYMGFRHCDFPCAKTLKGH